MLIKKETMVYINHLNFFDKIPHELKQVGI